MRSRSLLSPSLWSNLNARIAGCIIDTSSRARKFRDLISVLGRIQSPAHPWLWRKTMLRTRSCISPKSSNAMSSWCVRSCISNHTDHNDSYFVEVVDHERLHSALSKDTSLTDRGNRCFYQSKHRRSDSVPTEEVGWRTGGCQQNGPRPCSAAGREVSSHSEEERYPALLLL